MDLSGSKNGKTHKISPFPGIHTLREKNQAPPKSDFAFLKGIPSFEKTFHRHVRVVPIKAGARRIFRIFLPL